MTQKKVKHAKNQFADRSMDDKIEAFCGCETTRMESHMGLVLSTPL